MEPWWVCRLLVAELHHYYEEQDPDQTSHLNANLDPDLLLIKGKKFYTLPVFFVNLLRFFSSPVQKEDNFQFYDNCGYKKRYGMTTIFFHPLFCCCFWIRDPGWIKIRIRDPG